MKLKRLIKNITIQEVKGSKEISVTGICSHSHRVSPGNLFVAKRGIKTDVNEHIAQALQAGAVAILCDMYDPFLRDITQIIDPNVRRVEAALAAEFYQIAPKTLQTVGVTGTSGKTTTAYLIKSLLDPNCGLIGTIEYLIGPHSYAATHTTPDVCSTHKMLFEMVQHKCHSAVMEVSSHALDQGRVAGVDFSIAVFTNLSREHLDYHHTIEAYAKSKQKLFQSLPSTALAIVNKDDPWHHLMLEECSARVFTYGLTSESDLWFDQGHLHTRSEKVAFLPPLPGTFNRYNLLAAAAVGLAQKWPLKTIAAKLQQAPPVRGRLESVPNDLGLSIYVDYAHKDDALEKVLLSLMEEKKGRILTVFGCGGDRDREKRPRMASIAEKYSAYTFVTSDNPRKEDPLAICDEIVHGFSGSNYCVEIDRRRALQKALEFAMPGDTILIAGKGHETYQLFHNKTIDFDDRKVVKELCELMTSRAS